MPDYSKLAKGLSSLVKGEGKAARTFKTTDGYTFREMPDGTVTNGDMTWPNVKQFFQDMPHAYQEGDQLGARRAGMESYGSPTGEQFMQDWANFMSKPEPDQLYQQAINKQNAKPKLTVVKRKGGGVRMQLGGLARMFGRGAVKGTQEVLPLAEREANRAKFLAESVDPRTFYHGTKRDVPSFIPSNKGTFVSPDPKFASEFVGTKPWESGQNVMPVRVQVKKPFDYDNPEHIAALTEAAKKKYGHNAFQIKYLMDEIDALNATERMSKRNNNWASIERPEIQSLIKDLGHDSYYTSEFGTKNLSVYDPRKIKSDIGNRGTYDVTKPDINEAKGGAIRMQVGGALNLIKGLGKAGTKLTPAEEAALRARGFGIPGKDFADPLAPPTMRMSEALGLTGSEGKYLNFTEADRSRVFGPNRGGVGFSTLQHYSEPHKQAGTVWGFGNEVTAKKKIRQNDPENTVWTTYAGSPEQHKSNTVVVKDAVATIQAANKAGAVHPEQIRLINERIRQATNQNGKPIFPEGFDITDPNAMAHATTFDRRAAISDALMGVGVKKPMISKDFKQANPGVQWSDASDINKIMARETDPVLLGAETFDVGPHLFTMDNKIITRPDLNEAFPVQVTGTDLGMRFKPAPFRLAAPEFSSHFPEGAAINAWKMSRGNPRQFISEEYLTNLQKEGHKDGGSVENSFVQRLKSAIDMHMAQGGEVSDNTTPDMTDGGNINYGGQYANGGTINMPVRSLRRPKRMAGGGITGLISAGIEGAAKATSKAAPKVDRLSMSYKDVTKRVPEVAEAIEKLNRGEITKAQYNDIVNMYKPVLPYNFVPKPASTEEAIGALRGDAAKSRYGMQSEYEPGTKVGLRLDIPAYTNKGVWVNSIHDEKAKRVAYGPVSSVKNAELSASQAQSKKIAMGGEKAPYAKIKGEWNPMSEEEAVAKAQEYLNHPEWKQIGFDPERHSYFYDRATMAPITGADEVIQIGPLVLGKNPKYGKIEDFEYDEGGYVDPFGAPSAASADVGDLRLAGNRIGEQLAREKEALSTPEGRKDIALKLASMLPQTGMGGDIVDFIDTLQTLVPGLYKEEALSVLDRLYPDSVVKANKPETKREPKFALRNLLPLPTSKDFQEKFREAGWLGDTEAPITEFAGIFLAPTAVAKAPRIIEGGLNRATAAARRGSTPAMLTAEAVAPDLGQFRGSEWQNYLTKKLITEEGAPVGMTTMGGQATQKFPGQGLYVNKAGRLETNPMVGVSIPRAGNLSKNQPLLADIATAGQELGQEAMAAHRFIPMMTNQIKDATSMMITGVGGKPLTAQEVKALAARMPDMIVTHSPQTGGLFLAPFSPTKGIQPEFLEAQKAVQDVLGKGAKIQYGRTDPTKDLLYFGDYAEKGARAPSPASQEMRKKLKSMEVGFARKPSGSPSTSGGLNQVPAKIGD